MKMIKLNCSNCNGFTQLKIEADQKMAFCPYCGQKYIIDDEKIYIEVTHHVEHSGYVENIERKIDEADIIRAQNEESILKAKKELSEQETQKYAVIIGLPLLIVMTILIWVLGFVSHTS